MGPPSSQGLSRPSRSQNHCYLGPLLVMGIAAFCIRLGIVCKVLHTSSLVSDEGLCRATDFMEKEPKTGEMFTRNSALLVMHLLLR